MSRRAFEVYAVAAPVILAPLSFWLWWERTGGNIRLTLFAWLIPVLWAYVVPGAGTNVLKVWEFDSRFRLGRFRPQHGFVFGSATATLAWLALPPAAGSLTGIFRSALILASVLGFWNLLYDVRALRSGVLRVYNQPCADGLPAESIAFDYAPFFFAGFGAVEGAALATIELLESRGPVAPLPYVLFFLVSLFLGIAVPCVLYRRHSFRTHGHSGCHPVPSSRS